MKRFSLSIVFILLIGCSYAQDQHSSKNFMRVGFNGAFFGSGDIFGLAFSTEYVHGINDYFALTPRIMIANANTSNNVDNLFNEYQQISSIGTSLSVRISPFPKSFERLKVDIGCLYQRFTNSRGQYDIVDSYGTYPNDIVDYYSENLFGFIGSININLVDTKRFESGLRFELLTSLNKGYLDCDGIQGGIFIGFKL